MSTVVVKVDSVETTDITLVELTQSPLAAWSAVLRQDCRHESGTLTNNNLIEIEIDGVTQFYGWLVVNEPGGVAQEGVQYTAYDRRWFLENRVAVKINGSSQFVWNEDGNPDPNAPGYGLSNYWTVGECLLDILEHALGLPEGGTDIPTHHVGGDDVTDAYLTTSPWDDLILSYDAEDILAMTRELDEFEVSAAKLGNVITQLLQWQREVEWWIDPATGALVIHQTSDSASTYVRAGEVDHFIGETGKYFDLIDDAVHIDLEETFTKITLQGKSQGIEVRPSGLNTIHSTWPSDGAGNAELEPAWDPSEEAGWNEADADAGLYLGTAKEWVYRLYRAAAQDERRWREGWMGYSPLQYSGWCFYSDGASLHRCGLATTGFYNIFYNSGHILFIKYLPEAMREYQYYLWARVDQPFAVSVGPEGASAYTDYGLVSELALYSEDWEGPDSNWPNESAESYGTGTESRDDTTKMTDLATAMQAYYGQERMSVEVEIAPVGGEIQIARYGLTKKLNFSNLAGSKWGTAHLYIGAIRINPETETLKVSASNRLDGVTMDGNHLARLSEVAWKREKDRTLYNRQIRFLRKMLLNRYGTGT